MPHIDYYRLWCKTCNEYTLHLRDWNNPKHTCKECKSVFIETPLFEIPEQKRIEQNERWKKANSTAAKDVYLKTLLFGGALAATNMFGEVGSDFEIHECDAGVMDVQRMEREERIKQSIERDNIRKQQRTEAARYTKLGRNDICICGSGKKYKKCCMSKIQSYKI